MPLCPGDPAVERCAGPVCVCVCVCVSTRARMSSVYAALLICARREQGEYHNGHRNGKGKQTFANGNMYDGQFLLVRALLHACVSARAHGACFCVRVRKVYTFAHICTHFYTFVHICTCRQYIRVRVCSKYVCWSSCATQLRHRHADSYTNRLAYRHTHQPTCTQTWLCTWTPCMSRA